MSKGEFFQVYLDQCISLDGNSASYYDINIAPKGVFDDLCEGKEINNNIWDIVDEHFKESQNQSNDTIENDYEPEL